VRLLTDDTVQGSTQMSESLQDLQNHSGSLTSAVNQFKI